MSELKTDYKDQLLDTSVNTERKFNLVDSDGNVVANGISLKDITSYSQEGDSFGAADLNRTNSKINDLTDSLEEVKSLDRDYELLGSSSAQTANQNSYETVTLSKPISNFKSIKFVVTNTDNIHIYNIFDLPVSVFKNITSNGYVSMLGNQYSAQCYYISDTKISVKQTRNGSSTSASTRVDIYGY